ncbi:MAG: hypothetical protein AAFY71_03075 [Bacteroidota bacterium]
MKYISFSLLMLVCLSAFGQADVYDEKVSSAGNVAATISNHGIIGNSFSGSFNIEGFPSCEFPVGSGIEHLFEGALWIGAKINGNETHVSTGAVDDPTGYEIGKAGFEFTSKAGLGEISSLFSNPNYNPSAISHQDFFSVFTDTAVAVKTRTSEVIINDHDRPLGLQCEFRSLNWNFPFANFFIILNFKLTNIGNDTLEDAFFGYWIDGVIRNTNITPPGGTAFYNKGGNGFIDSMDMAYEFDAIGDIGFTDSYVGTKFLGAEYNGTPHRLIPGLETNFNTWQFRNTGDILYFSPRNDIERYGKLSIGMEDLSSWPMIQQTINIANNRSNLISIGPIKKFFPGDVVEIAFAIVCAKRVKEGNPAADNNPAQRDNLVRNALWAQTAYDGEDLNANGILDPGEDADRNGRITRFILPSPPDIPNTRVEVGDGEITLYWSNNAEASIDPISKKADFEGYKLYKTALGFDVQATQDIFSDLNLVAQWDKEGNALFFDNGFESIELEEPITFPEDTNVYFYSYTFENISNGWQHGIALTAFDEGDEVNNLESLESTPLGNLFRTFAGTTPNEGFANGEPFVYPNPYYAEAAWEGVSTFEEDRKIYFANLPSRCEIRVYTVAGDLVKIIQHDQDTYDGSDSRWFSTYANPEQNTFSGGEHAWDLLSTDNQIIARGLYLFVVIDEATGEKRKGKFVVIK